MSWLDVRQWYEDMDDPDCEKCNDTGMIVATERGDIVLCECRYGRRRAEDHKKEMRQRGQRWDERGMLP